MPGGIAFSVNSVGHMAKSAMIGKVMLELDRTLDVDGEDWTASKVDSLGKALELAMLTINKAADAVSGKATWLLPLPGRLADLPVQKCPIELPPPLVARNFCEYEGYYHTDFTIPSEYFLPDVERPLDLSPRTLDFTYLFDGSIDNPDYIRVGAGRLLRGSMEADYRRGIARKRLRVSEEEVSVRSCDRLVKALQKC